MLHKSTLQAQAARPGASQASVMVLPSRVCALTPMRQSPPARRAAPVARVVIKARTERLDNDIAKVLYSEEQLNEILDDLGRQIGADYHDKDLLVLGVLKGGFVFTADLVRHLSPVPKSVEVDFIRAASYGLGLSSSGQVQLDKAFDLSIVKDKHVLVAEDIIDTGLTMSTLVKRLRSAGAMSVRVAVLLDKRTRRSVTYDADYVGCQCPDEFVVGYGIDFAERYRWLPYVGVPKPEVVVAIKAQRLEQLEQLEQAKAKAEQKQQQRQAGEEAAAARQVLANACADGNGHTDGYSNGHATGVSSNGSSKGNGSSSGSVSSVGNRAVAANKLLLKVGNGAVAVSTPVSCGSSMALLAKPVPIATSQ